jgi:hypothetical protein
MPDHLNRILLAQHEAALCMLRECIERCPPQHWDAPIAKYPFWMVAYHALCFADFRLATSDAAWQPRPDFHPRGRAELDDEYPSRTFTQPELLAYADLCLRLARATIPAESRATLEGPSGFPRLPFSRAELHIYNTRHIQHHTGQLSASLRRIGVDTGWASSGRREPARP